LNKILLLFRNLPNCVAETN